MADILKTEFWVDNKDALEKLGKFESKLNGLASTVGGGVKAAFVALAAQAAAVGVEMWLSIDAAMEAEDAQKHLDQALQKSGQATKENSEALSEQAKRLQNTTKNADEVIQGMQAMGLAMGMTVPETMKITDAATDLASAMGMDAQTAAMQLSRTMSGVVPRSLKMVVPELENLTEKELEAGKAVDIIAQKFGGFAQSEARALSGSLTILRNQFGEIHETIGAAYTDNEQLKVGMSGLTEVISEVIKLVEENKDGLRDLASFGFIVVVESISYFTEGMIVAIDVCYDLAEGLMDLLGFVYKWAIPVRAVSAALEKLGVISQPLHEYFDDMSKSIADSQDGFRKFGDKVFSITGKMHELSDRMVKAGSGTKDFAAKQKDASKPVGDLSKKIEDQKKAIDQLDKEFADFDVNMAFTKYNQKPTITPTINFDADKFFKDMDRAANDAAAAEAANLALQQKEAMKQAAYDAANAFVQGIASGNMASAFGGVLTAAASVAFGPMGQIIAGAAGPVLDMIMNKTKAEMDSFFDGMITQVNNLVNNLDDFLGSLAEFLVEMSIRLMTLPTELAAAFIAAIPDMIAGLVTGFIDGAKNLISNIGDFFKGVWEDLKSLFTGEKTKKEQTYEEKRQSIIGAQQHGYMTEAEAGEALQALESEERSKRANEAYYQQQIGGADAYDQQRNQVYSDKYAGRISDQEAGRRLAEIDRAEESAKNDQLYLGTHSPKPSPRASGGPVEAGRSYLVGEHGPEVIVPRNRGSVVPSAAAGNVVFNVTLHSNNPVDAVNALRRMFKQAVVSGSIRSDSNPFYAGAY